jgi:Uma2 family endonuclease
MKRMSTSERLLTAEEVLAPEYERGQLWDGVFVVGDPAGGSAGVIEARVVARLAQPTLQRLGWAFGASQGYVVARNPDRVLAADASFVLRAWLPELPERGFIEGAPDFAAEVRSPSDSWIATVEKGGIWIAHGAQVVWCIDPPTQRVAVLRPGRQPVIFRRGESAGLVPVAELDVAIDELFEGLGQPSS